MTPETVGHVSAAPTLPGSGARPEDVTVTIAELFGEAPAAAQEQQPALDEKLRQAYFWIVNHAIISPHYDLEFDDPEAGASSRYLLGDSRAEVNLPSGQSYSSFVLLPLLTFAVRGRCLLVGGPGRGKTASAILMGVLAGYPVREVKRAMQHGHPQLTVSDLFGTPLPKGLVSADRLSDVDIAWRSWLGMRVKVVDEYNRIPTRTQAALLTLLADGYVEVMDQVYETGDSAWYLTANDDAGGGTYQVVEALKDRIDVVVQALPFNNRFLGSLVERAERRSRPEEHVPPDVVFSETEHHLVADQVRAVTIPPPVRRRLEFFAGQFELAERAGVQFEYRTKDTARLAGADPHQVLAADTGRDRLSDLGAQTLSGLSVRALQALVAYAKALAFFRGRSCVGTDDLRAILPFVLHQKLPQDPDAPALSDDDALRTDRISWLRGMFDTACQQYDALDLDRDDPIGALLSEFDAGLDGVSAEQVRSRLARVERQLAALSDQRKLYGHHYDDVLLLKYLHQRYTNYLAWLRWR